MINQYKYYALDYINDHAFIIPNKSPTYIDIPKINPSKT